MAKVKKNVIIFQRINVVGFIHEKIILVINMLYNERLKYLRERAGLTQKEVGALINIDSGTYCHYEKEELLIPIKHLNTLCNYFSVSLDYIFKFSNNKTYKNIKQDINKDISKERLKKFRKDNNLTQEKLAKILNISRTTITEYERGTNFIATPFLYTISSKFNISADYLLGKIDNPIHSKKSFLNK